MNRFWTVCIPCYNPDDRLDNLLQSIVNQNCSDDIEVIVIDDCSTEDFQPILDKYKDKLFIKKYVTEINGGPVHLGSVELSTQQENGLLLLIKMMSLFQILLNQ